MLSAFKKKLKLESSTISSLALYIYLPILLSIFICSTYLEFNKESLLKTFILFISSLIGIIIGLKFGSNKKVSFNKSNLIYDSEKDLQESRSFVNDLLKSINILSVIGLFLLIIFVFKNTEGSDLFSIVVFTEKYRNSFFAGSGVFTGISIYLIPSLIAYLILKGVSLKKIILPVITMLIAVILLGLRIIIVLPVIAIILRFYQPTKFFKRIIRKKVIKQNFLVLIFALFILILPKLIIGSVYEDVANPVTIFNSIFVRFSYLNVLGFYDYNSINGLECFLPFFLNSGNCDFSLLQYEINSELVGFEYSGNYEGFSIPLIPLLYIYRLNLFELSTIGIIGNYLIIFISKYFIGSDKFKLNSTFSCLIYLYIDFVLILLLPVLLIGIYTSYFAATNALEDIIFAGLFPPFVYLMRKQKILRSKLNLLKKSYYQK